MFDEDGMRVKLFELFEEEKSFSYVVVRGEK